MNTMFVRHRRHKGRGSMPLTPPPFDPAAQLVSTSGEHKWVPPGPGDDRGPCPALNALANHGYLPHNGRATDAEFIKATNEVYGFALDVGTLLGTYGSIVDGTGTSFSIGGTAGRGPLAGIGGSHHTQESDSSVFKPDLSQYATTAD